MPVNCPSCDGPLRVTRLRCGRCGTAVEGDFDLGLGSLSGEEGSFARAFLLARGNLRELERTLGLSYAALRGRLDTLVTHLEGQITRSLGEEPEGAGQGEGQTGSMATVPGILDRLEAGEIGADEAVRLLRGDAAERADD
jgi:hypothetical protein